MGLSSRAAAVCGCVCVCSVRDQQHRSAGSKAGGMLSIPRARIVPLARGPVCHTTATDASATRIAQAAAADGMPRGPASWSIRCGETSRRGHGRMDRGRARERRRTVTHPSSSLPSCDSGIFLCLLCDTFRVCPAPSGRAAGCAFSRDFGSKVWREKITSNLGTAGRKKHRHGRKWEIFLVFISSLEEN